MFPLGLDLLELLIDLLAILMQIINTCQRLLDLLVDLRQLLLDLLDELVVTDVRDELIQLGLLLLQLSPNQSQIVFDSGFLLLLFFLNGVLFLLPFADLWHALFQLTVVDVDRLEVLLPNGLSELL